MGKFIWMRVSHDCFELPEVIGNSAADLAQKCNTTKTSIISAIKQAEKNGYKSVYKRVEIIDDEEEE